MFNVKNFIYAVFTTSTELFRLCSFSFFSFIGLIPGAVKFSNLDLQELLQVYGGCVSENIKNK